MIMMDPFLGFSHMVSIFPPEKVYCQVGFHMKEIWSFTLVDDNKHEKKKRKNKYHKSQEPQT